MAGDARIAVNLNVAYEGGGERNILDGDDGSEGLLIDTGFPSAPGARNPLVESAFEYGSRVDIWRLLRIFEQLEIPASMVAVANTARRRRSGHPDGLAEIVRRAERNGSLCANGKR